MPSKKIFLKCSRPFIHEDNKSEAAVEQFNLSKRGVGSFFVSVNSRRQGTGLVDEEVKILLPYILDNSVTDRDFRKEVELFYVNINTIVPYEHGLELEIGLELDNDKPITYTEKRTVKPAKVLQPAIPAVEARPAVPATDTTPAIPEVLARPEIPAIMSEPEVVIVYNTPINYEDYVRYRHARAHPLVAGSPDEAKGNSLCSFYLEDPMKTINDKVLASEMKDKSIVLFQTLKSDPDKIKMILTLLRLDIPKKPGEIIIISNLNDDQRLLKLRELVDRQPIKFYQTATDEKLKNKYLIEEMINMEILKRVGQSIIIESTSEPMGSSMEEAVYNLFEDAKNNQTLNLLRTKYKEKKNLTV